MADKNKNWLWIGIAVIVVIVLAVIFISNSDKSSSNEFTCNSPYIKVGASCCLDQNSNNICDNDERIVGQEPSNNAWKELYESECYGEEGIISKSQAENIAKHYVVIQTNLNAKNLISTGDIKTKTPTSTIGEKCNPDWFVSLEIDYTDKYDNSETSRWFIVVSGRTTNETLQGTSFLPDDYVLKEVEASINYHTKSSTMPFVGGSETHSSPFSNIP
ncbi:hypothetical protein HYT57_01915 [Candidatus Woesearchaeota archaeon]|nr:hypothetical protein [Candidatus Woesearchaeota archaeon]